jgi:transcriptional regulator with XRE-family HTH domain
MEQETLWDWGQRLRARRAGISQERLGELAGVDQSTISRLEHGKLEVVSDSLKWRIAGALGCPVGDLFPYPNVRPPFPADLSKVG